MTEKKRCFVIAPMGEENTRTRQLSDRIYEDFIKEIAKKCNYEAIHPARLHRAGLITPEIIKHVISDPLVIADLTGGNPNVLYELALRHAVRMPVVQFVAKGQPKLPFNIQETRTIVFDIDNVNSRKKAISDMIEEIRDLENNSSPIKTPVSSAEAVAWVPFPGSESPHSQPHLTGASSSAAVKHTDDLTEKLREATPAEAIPLVMGYIEDLRKNHNVRILGKPIDDLDAACTLVERVPDNGYLSGTSSLQHEDADERDADERESYRTAVNHALENNVTYRKIICSGSDLTPQRREKWLREFTDKAELIKESKIEPEAFKLFHYPAPLSVDVLISQDSNRDPMEMVAGFAGGTGHGGFYTKNKRMVDNWLEVYLEKKIIVEAERHTKAVLDGEEECPCKEFLMLLEEARKHAAASQPNPVAQKSGAKRARGKGKRTPDEQRDA